MLKVAEYQWILLCENLWNNFFKDFKNCGTFIKNKILQFLRIFGNSKKICYSLNTLENSTFEIYWLFLKFLQKLVFLVEVFSNYSDTFLSKPLTMPIYTLLVFSSFCSCLCNFYLFFLQEQKIHTFLHNFKIPKVDIYKNLKTLENPRNI